MLEVVERAVEELRRYLKRKTAEIRGVERLMKGATAFNHRQLALLSDALRHPDRTYTFTGHAGSHGVTHETARTDLTPLAERDLLERRRLGRRQLFSPAPDLADRLRNIDR